MDIDKKSWQKVAICGNRHEYNRWIVDNKSLAVNYLEDEDRPRLSRREREILTLLAKGMKGSEISKQLWLSPETVRTHVRNAVNKLGARTRTQAVVIALIRGEIRVIGQSE